MGALTASRHLAFSGSLLPAGAFCSAAALIALGFVTGHHMCTLLGLYCGMLCILGLELRGRLTRAPQDSVDLGSHLLGTAIVAWMLTVLAIGFAYRPLSQVPELLGGSVAFFGVVLASLLIWTLKAYYSSDRSMALREAGDVLPWLRMGLTLAGAACLAIASVEFGFAEGDTLIVRISALIASIPASRMDVSGTGPSRRVPAAYWQLDIRWSDVWRLQPH